jgi:hypothetical protein
VPFTLIHAVTITMPGSGKATTFQRRYDLPCPPQNGLRISLGRDVASFVVEDLVFHVGG